MKPQKLIIQSETVRQLTGPELHDVHGGEPPESAVGGDCPSLYACTNDTTCPAPGGGTCSMGTRPNPPPRTVTVDSGPK